MNRAATSYLVLFANCIPVKGASNSVIYDLQRNAYEHIPNDLYDFLMEIPKHSLQKLIDLYGEENQEIIEEYIHFICTNEFGFITKTPELFPPLEQQWYSPAHITNAIIEITPTTFPYLQKIIDSLEHLGCEHVLLKLDSSLQFHHLATTLATFENTIVGNIQVFAYHDCCVDIETYRQEIETNQQIDACFLQSSTLQIAPLADQTEKLKICRSLKGKTAKYQVFSINNTHFAEAQYHHTYFNRKLYIGKEGELKNAPECVDIFGSIQQIPSSKTIIDIVETAGFRKFWYIKKDNCKVCQDCPYRYMCLDNRLPIQQVDGQYDFEQACEYNPYTFEWESLQEALVE